MNKVCNDNCLLGYTCPKCGSLGPYVIRTEVYLLWDDGGYDGDEVEGEADFKDDASCTCVACGHKGVTLDFNAEAEPEKPLDIFQVVNAVNNLLNATKDAGFHVKIKGGKSTPYDVNVRRL